VKIEAVKIEGKIREVFISHLRRNAELNSAAIVFPFHPLRCDACHHAV
jgi:predicted HNH restriction endonuclease